MHRREFMAAAAGGLGSGRARRLRFELGAQQRVRVRKATDAAALERRPAICAVASSATSPMSSAAAGPAALFLHGFPLSSFQWRGAFDRLAGERRCVAADFLGLGFTQVAPGQSCAPSAQVEMLAALLDSLSIDTVDLVANDSGGAVAQLFVLRYPQRVRTMLLTNCDVEPDSPPPALQPVLAAAREGKFADDVARAVGREQALARAKDGLGGQTFTYPENPTDEAIDQYLAPLVSSPERKALTHAYALGARSESARRHRGGAQALHCADADRLGHGRHDLLEGQPGLSRSHCCRTRAACGASRARSCSSRRSSRM